MKKLLVIFVALCLVVGVIPAALAETSTYKIGMYQVMSGANAIYGEEAKNALDLMTERINSQGGLNGAQVETVIYDDQGSPEEAVKAVTKLIDVDHIDACVSSCISSCILASAGKLNDSKIITFGTGLSPTYMQQGWDYVFRACVNSDYVAPVTVSLTKDIGIETLAIFRGQDESAIATANTFAEHCATNGIEVLTEEAYNDGDSDFSGQVTKIMSKNPDAVFISTVGATYGIFIKQLRQYGYEGIIINKEALPTDAIQVAGDAADHVMFASPYLTYSSVDECDVENLKAFLVEYQEKFGSLPATDCAYRVYDSLLTLFAAAERAGSNDPDAIRDAICQISDLEGLGGTLDYTDGTNEGLHSFAGYMRVNGQNVLLENWKNSDDFAAWKAE